MVDEKVGRLVGGLVVLMVASKVASKVDWTVDAVTVVMVLTNEVICVILLASVMAEYLESSMAERKVVK